jgi:hypothetical protein
MICHHSRNNEFLQPDKPLLCYDIAYQCTVMFDISFAVIAERIDFSNPTSHSFATILPASVPSYWTYHLHHSRNDTFLQPDKPFFCYNIA